MFHRRFINRVSNMYCELINGLEAEIYFHIGVPIQFVRLGEWFDLTPKELYLLKSNLYIFRLKK